MPMTRPYVKDRKTKIVKCAKAGLNAQQMATRLGCKKHSITRYLNEWGFEWDRGNLRWVPRVG